MPEQAQVEVWVDTTKPRENQAEYSIREVGTGVPVRHGILIPVAIESLSPEDQATLARARSILTAFATAHAVSQGYISAP